MKLDEKNKKILQLLQEDCRMPLTTMAKKIGLSIDATHKRMKKLKENKVFYASVKIDPRKLGYPISTDVKIRLKDVDEKEYKRFIKYLTSHPKVHSVFTTQGHWDLTAPMIAKDAEDLDELFKEIRHKFKDIIASWETATNLKFYKYEYYDMTKL